MKHIHIHVQLYTSIRYIYIQLYKLIKLIVTTSNFLLSLVSFAFVSLVTNNAEVARALASSLALES